MAEAYHTVINRMLIKFCFDDVYYSGRKTDIILLVAILVKLAGTSYSLDLAQVNGA